MKKAVKIVSVIVFLLIPAFFIESIVMGSEYVEGKYGLDPTDSFILFIIVEVLFDLGLLIMALDSGFITKVNWRKVVFKLDLESFKNVTNKGTMFNLGLGLSTIVWIGYFVYIIAMSWQKMPVVILLLCFAEIGITVATWNLVRGKK